MAVIPQNTPGTRSNFDEPIFTDAVGKAMLICTPKTEKETVFRIIPELNAQGQVVPMCRTYDATGHDWSNLTIEEIARNNGIMGKFTGSVIPGRPGDTTGAPDTSIGEPDLPFCGLYIRLKGRVNKNSVPLEHQAQVTQILSRGQNRPAPLDTTTMLIWQAWILCDNGTWLVDANRQPAPRRGFIMMKASHGQAMKLLLTEAFSAGLDLFNPDTGACFRAAGFPAGTFPGQQLATGTMTLCTMQGQPLTFRGHSQPPTPQGRQPVVYQEYGPATASPLPPAFWQGPNAFMPWGKCIRRYTLQELLAKQLACFGPAVCQLAFPNEYGAPMQINAPQGQPQAPQQPAFGQQPPQQPAFGTPVAPQQVQQPAFGTAPAQPAAPQQPQQPAFQPQQQAFGALPAQAPQQPAFAPQAPQQAQQPAFGQQQPMAPQGPAANAFGAPSLQQAVNPQQPVAPVAPAPVVATSDAAALQAAFAATLGQQIPKV